MNPTEIRNLRLALSRAEVAAALGVSTKSVDRLVRRGLLHPSRALRRPLFQIDEVERFLAATSQPVGS